MPKDAIKVSPTPLSLGVSSWDELKANPAFLEWYKSPFLKLMTAALRVSSPVSGAIDPHAMIRDGGIAQGYMIALLTVDDFCNSKEQEREKIRNPHYAGSSKPKED